MMMPTLRDPESGGLRFARRVHRPEHSAAAEIGRMAALLWGVYGPGNVAVMCAALDIAYPCFEEQEDCAPLMALNQIGLTAARIVKQGSRWRFALPHAQEESEGALLLPVGCCDALGGAETCLLLCGNHEHRAVDRLEWIADIVAIPLDGSRALSFTGMTAAVGRFQVSDNGDLALAASGLGFIKRHVRRARAATKDYAPHLVSRFLPLPDACETLVLAPECFEWRLTEGACVVPESAKRVACVDSPALARFVDEAMKKRERVRKAPPVLAPKV